MRMLFVFCWFFVGLINRSAKMNVTLRMIIFSRGKEADMRDNT